jgi:hypothetical protein
MRTQRRLLSVQELVRSGGLRLSKAFVPVYLADYVVSLLRCFCQICSFPLFPTPTALTAPLNAERLKAFLEKHDASVAPADQLINAYALRVKLLLEKDQAGFKQLEDALMDGDTKTTKMEDEKATSTPHNLLSFLRRLYQENNKAACKRCGFVQHQLFFSGDARISSELAGNKNPNAGRLMEGWSVFANKFNTEISSHVLEAMLFLAPTRELGLSFLIQPTRWMLFVLPGCGDSPFSAADMHMHDDDHVSRKIQAYIQRKTAETQLDARMPSMTSCFYLWNNKPVLCFVDGAYEKHDVVFGDAVLKENFATHTVTDENLQDMRLAVSEGRCRFLNQKKQRQKRLFAEQDVQVGDTLEVAWRPGDAVLFFRHPLDMDPVSLRLVACTGGHETVIRVHPALHRQIPDPFVCCFQWQLAAAPRLQLAAAQRHQGNMKTNTLMDLLSSSDERMSDEKASDVFVEQKQQKSLFRDFMEQQPQAFGFTCFSGAAARSKALFPHKNQKPEAQENTEVAVRQHSGCITIDDKAYVFRDSCCACAMLAPGCASESLLLDTPGRTLEMQRHPDLPVEFEQITKAWQDLTAHRLAFAGYGSENSGIGVDFEEEIQRAKDAKGEDQKTLDIKSAWRMQQACTATLSKINPEMSVHWNRRIVTECCMKHVFLRHALRTHAQLSALFSRLICLFCDAQASPGAVSLAADDERETEESLVLHVRLASGVGCGALAPHLEEIPVHEIVKDHHWVSNVKEDLCGDKTWARGDATLWLPVSDPDIVAFELGAGASAFPRSATRLVLDNKACQRRGLSVVLLIRAFRGWLIGHEAAMSVWAVPGDLVFVYLHVKESAHRMGHSFDAAIYDRCLVKAMLSSCIPQTDILRVVVDAQEKSARLSLGDTFLKQPWKLFELLARPEFLPHTAVFRGCHASKTVALCFGLGAAVAAAGVGSKEALLKAQYRFLNDTPKKQQEQESFDDLVESAVTERLVSLKTQASLSINEF